MLPIYERYKDLIRILDKYNFYNASSEEESDDIYED